MFIMPSRYEACGLSQMIAMRYGTIPIVRETGGLKDSVINFDKYTTPEGNGFSFANFNAHELLFTIKRALTCYEEKPLWEKIVCNAMHSDNSWNRSAQAYADLYARIAGDTITVEPVTEEQVEKVEEEILQAVKGEETAEGSTEMIAPEAVVTEPEASAEEVVVKTAAEESKAAVVAETETEEVKAEEAVAKADEAIAKPVEEAKAKKTVKRKTAAKKKTVKKAEEQTETEKKPATKKVTARKTTAKKSAAATEEGAEAKKSSARKTTARKKTDAAVDVTTGTTEAAAESAPKKRGRKPGTKNKKKDAE